jgi:hypothetical protein
MEYHHLKNRGRIRKTSYNNLTIILKFEIPELQRANLKSHYHSCDKAPVPK